tara:strand:- start:758 stop:1168 length:411 start_codon:yes stop_codon:yes gene_type:complete
MVAPVPMLIGITARAVAAYAKKYGKRKANEQLKKNIHAKRKDLSITRPKDEKYLKREIMNSEEVKKAIKDFDVSKIYTKAKGNTKIKTVEDAQRLIKKITPKTNNLLGEAKYFLKDQRKGEAFLKREIASQLKQKK